MYSHKENKQIDPEQINKMPVGAHQLHRYAVIVPDLGNERFHQHDQQSKNPAQHVHCMKASDDIQKLGYYFAAEVILGTREYFIVRLDDQH